MLGEFTVNIEVVGTCNLSCPSCPVGNYGAEHSHGGTMTVARFTEAIAWVRREISPLHRDVFVALYSWGEPLIHPRIGDLIRIARAAGFRVGLSSNLNHARHIEDAIVAGVDEFVVSLSGFHQEVYAQSHRGGDIAVVKANMAELARLIRLHDASPSVHVHYIAYRHNVGSDVTEMAELADRLGFQFTPSPAYFLPVEKLIEATAGHIDPRDQPIVDRLLIPLPDQLAAARRATVAGEACDLIKTRLDIDVDGAVKLCCSSYERRHNPAPSLDGLDFATIQARRSSAALCGPCMENGIHRIYTRKDNDDTIDRADAALAEIGSPHRFGAPGGLAVQAATETTQLDRLLRTMNAGKLREAWALRQALHAMLAAKYNLAEPLHRAILQRLAQPKPRRGVNLPQDPARLLFADAVLTRNLHKRPRDSRKILDGIVTVLDRLEPDAGYRETTAEMRPIVASWQALPLR